MLVGLGTLLPDLSEVTDMLMPWVFGPLKNGRTNRHGFPSSSDPPYPVAVHYIGNSATGWPWTLGVLI